MTIDQTHCPVFPGARAVLANARNLKRAAQRLRRALQSCDQCPVNAPSQEPGSRCPLLREWSFQIERAIAATAAELRLDRH
jgi:hypothetical protein